MKKKITNRNFRERALEHVTYLIKVQWVLQRKDIDWYVRYLYRMYFDCKKEDLTFADKIYLDQVVEDITKQVYRRRRPKREKYMLLYYYYKEQDDTRN